MIPTCDEGHGRVMKYVSVLPIAVIPLLVGLVYFNSLHNEFHQDDGHSIVHNHHIRSLGNIPEFFVQPGSFSREPGVGMYRPILLITYAVNYAVSGYDVVGFRIVNVLLHSLCAIMVFVLFKQISKSVMASWLFAIGFSVHPINSQTVIYISNRSELLSAVFLLAAVLLLKAGQSTRIKGSFCCYAFALLTKSTALAFLPILAVLEWCLSKFEHFWSRYWSFAVLTLCYLIIITLNGFLPQSLSNIVRPFDHQIFTQSKAFVLHTFLMFMPVNLSIDHGLKISTSLNQLSVIASIVFIVSLLYITFWCSKRHRLFVVGFLWFVVGIGLVMGMPLNVTFSEHRVYLSSVGFLLSLLVIWPNSKRQFSKWIGILFVVFLAVITFNRNKDWLNPITIWEDANRKGNTARIQNALGHAYHSAGDIHKAKQHLEASLVIDPKNEASWLSLGIILEESGMLYAAEKAYDKALKSKPNMAAAWKNIGRIYLKSGRENEAEKALLKSLDIDSLYPQTHANLGFLYSKNGRLGEAEKFLKSAVRLDPDNDKYGCNLANVYLQKALESDDIAFKKKMLDQAIRESSAVLARDPASVPALMSKASIAEAQENEAVARQYFEKAYQVDSLNVSILIEYGRFEARSGRHRKAIKMWQVAIDQGDKSVFGDTGNSWFSLGQFDQAISSYRAGCRTRPSDLTSCYNLGEMLLRIGNNWQQRGNLDKALVSWRDAHITFLKVADVRPMFRHVSKRLHELDNKLQ